MNPLKPLLFLATRSIFNGLKRAITTPRRLISLVIFVGYYFFFFIRPSLGSNSFQVPGAPQFDFPPIQLIQAVAFGVFALLSLLMMLGLTATSGGFRPPDIDILFATPISPRLVLLFRIVRDYLVTLIVPVFIVLISIKPVKMGWTAIFRNIQNPEYAPLTIKFMAISWLLMSLCWVCIGYAVSLFINRSDTQSDRNRKALGWGLAGIIVIVGVSIAVQIPQVQDIKGALAIVDSPLLRGVFFTASFASMITVAPLSGNWTSGLVGLLGLLSIIGLSLKIALSQSSWMYDQAAVKGFGSNRSRELQKAGDVIGVVAERARAGKFKVKSGWLSRLRMKGPFALLWKELIIQRRSMLGMGIALTLLGVFMTLMPAFIPSEKPDMAPGLALLMMQGIVLFMTTSVLSQVGFTEVLRRVDLQKPMPFKASTIVIAEVFSKAVVGCLGTWLGALLAVIIQPKLWQFAAAGSLLCPFMGLLLSSVAFLAVMLFPDVDDPSQRQFRGLVSMLATIIFVFFPVGAMVTLLYFKVFPILSALVAAAICLGLTALVSMISGHLYSGFNPSE